MSAMEYQLNRAIKLMSKALNDNYDLNDNYELRPELRDEMNDFINEFQLDARGHKDNKSTDQALSLSDVSVSLRDEMATRFAQTKMITWDGELSNKHREAILEDWINRYGEGLTIAQNIVKDAYYLADEMLKHK